MIQNRGWRKFLVTRTHGTDRIHLNETERDILATALDIEYKPRGTCRQVIRDFGPVRPLINSACIGRRDGRP